MFTREGHYLGRFTEDVYRGSPMMAHQIILSTGSNPEEGDFIPVEILSWVAENIDSSPCNLPDLNT